MHATEKELGCSILIDNTNMNVNDMKSVTRKKLSEIKMCFLIKY